MPGTFQGFSWRTRCRSVALRRQKERGNCLLLHYKHQNKKGKKSSLCKHTDIYDREDQGCRYAVKVPAEEIWGSGDPAWESVTAAKHQTWRDIISDQKYQRRRSDQACTRRAIYHIRIRQIRSHFQSGRACKKWKPVQPLCTKAQHNRWGKYHALQAFRRRIWGKIQWQTKQYAWQVKVPSWWF